MLEHIVDTVLYFEGDPHSSFRLVRAIKNRFGAANELGVFAMTERGLKGVANPSALFITAIEVWFPSDASLKCTSDARSVGGFAPDQPGNAWRRLAASRCLNTTATCRRSRC